MRQPARLARAPAAAVVPWRCAAAAGAVAAAVVLGAALATSALGAGGRDPQQLVLARSDLPGAKPVAKATGTAPATSWIAAGASAKALLRTAARYQAAYHLPAKDVWSAAFVFRSQAEARRAFSALAGSLDVVHRRMKLARLGDAQVTTYVVADGLEHRFIVRRRSVVWQLVVVDWNAVSRTTSGAEAFALARRQQARVG